MSEVIKFPNSVELIEPPKVFLGKAKDWGLERVVLVGHDREGQLLWGGNFKEREMFHWLLSCTIREIFKELE